MPAARLGAQRRAGVIDALGEYEREMPRYGFAAVRQSLRNAQQAGSANSWGRAAFRAVLRTINAMPVLKKRMAAGLGNQGSAPQ